MEELANVELEEYEWHEILACLHHLLSKCEFANSMEKIYKKSKIEKKGEPKYSEKNEITNNTN